MLYQTVIFFYGIAITCDARTVYVINSMSGVSSDAVSDIVRDIKTSGTSICIGDIKGCLNDMDFSECDTNVLDAGIAAYLLNPLRTPIITMIFPRNTLR